ncbi:MAG: hypothetical protein ACHQ9S_19885 [Candidatus Binatia bacterium]
MSLLLRVTGILSLGWAVFLLMLKDQVIAVGQLSPLVRALANGLGIANLALAYVFWRAASDPATNRGSIYAAIILLALKVANDLYELLVLLPASQATVSLGDLVASLALLVGILEALPRTLAAGRTSDVVEK